MYELIKIIFLRNGTVRTNKMKFRRSKNGTKNVRKLPKREEVLQHAHSYFCLGVHVPPGVSIWGYMFIFEGTHILELFFHSKRIEAMKSDHLDVYNSDIIML